MTIGDPMAMLSLRLDDDLREDLEDLARASGVSVSTLIRQQIGLALGRDLMASRPDESVRLTVPERAMWALKCEELAIQHGDDDYEQRRFERMAHALRRGYTAEYQDLFGDIESELSRVDCRLVWDILDMFRVLAPSIGNLQDSELAELGEPALRTLRFAGLDLNDEREGKMLSYLRFLVEGGRWAEIENRLNEVGDGGNSHSPMLQRYERMLAVYQPLFQKKLRAKGVDAAFRYNVSELQSIADAAVHPSRRNARSR